MACQFSVFLGIHMRSLLDIPAVARPPVPEDYDPDDYDPELEELLGEWAWGTGKVLTRTTKSGQVVTLPIVHRIHQEDEMGIFHSGESGTVFGVKLNGRYRSVFLDADAGSRGEGDFLALDVEEIQEYLQIVREDLPGAQLIIVHEHF